MKMLHRKFINTLLALVLAASNVAFVPTAAAATDMYGNYEKPSGGAILTDAVLVRPLMVGATALGIVTFIVTLPFSALGGNVSESGETLVMEPVEYTFVRPLGEM